MRRSIIVAPQTTQQKEAVKIPSFNSRKDTTKPLMQLLIEEADVQNTKEREQRIK